MKKTTEIVFLNGRNIELPIKRPQVYKAGTLRFGFTIEGEGKDKTYVGNVKHIYRCHNAKPTEEMKKLTNCGFMGSWEEVKKHMLYCEEGEEE